MPSTSKTKTLRLNQFVGSDKPKMDDFNYDNTQLETLVGGHLDDTEKHLTQAEREEWSRPSSELYFYDGNDASQRSFTLDFEPRFCTVYALKCRRRSMICPRPLFPCATMRQPDRTARPTRGHRPERQDPDCL